MLTESCVMFFSLSRAVLSTILQDEYLTSAVRTKERDKAGSNQPPARDPVQFSCDTLIGGFESTRIPQMPLVETFAPVMLRNWSSNFRIAFLEKFWKD